MMKKVRPTPQLLLVCVLLALCIVLPFVFLACNHQPPIDTSSSDSSSDTPEESNTESASDTDYPAGTESGGTDEPADTDEPTDTEPEDTEPVPDNVIHGFEVDIEMEKALGFDFEVRNERMMAHGNVWLRTEPSTAKGDASKIEILYSKTEITRIGYTEKWSRVVHNGRVCYVSSTYLVGYAPQNDKTDIFYEGTGKNKNIIIAIDAGHQLFAMNDTEPNGPGSTDMKVKVTSGTVGVATGIWEYQLNLDVALRLRDLFLDAGYSVVMIRETNNVTISNVERAEIANKYGADAFVRIHANSSENTNTRGALTICQSPSNRYNANIYKECKSLSQSVINEFCKATGFENDGVWENDTMTGINWCQVPTTIVEMGYMSNRAEDTVMATDGFMDNAARGIFAGVEKFVQSNHVFG